MFMSVSSQDQPFQLFSCKWAWCRSTFSNNAGLIHHVVHDHVHRAIPVRRRDISMIRRAEEGNGESFKISELIVDMHSYSSRESISHKSAEPPHEPSSSLPSPPASSPALHSPHRLGHSPGPAPSPSLLSLEHKKKHILIKPRSPVNISRQTSPHLTSFKPLQGQNPAVHQSTTFASLSSPEPKRPPFSFEMPDSPSFTSLVERPNKHKMTSDIACSISHNKTHTEQPHTLSLSYPSSASLNSQNSVEAHLTQTEQFEDDIDQDEDLELRYHSSNGLLSQAPDSPLSSFGLIREHDGYEEEVQWEPSQPAEEYLMSCPTLHRQSNSHPHLENLPVMSQPPSQLRLGSEFPFHLHDRPRGSISGAPHTVLDPSAAMPLSPLSPTSSPTFAVSTPVRQNWYQPPLKRRKKSTCNDKFSDHTPSKVEASVSQTKSKKMFRSGTLQITPASFSEESKVKHTTVDAPSMNTDSDLNCRNILMTPDSPYDLEIFSQSSQHSSDISEIISYPALQTQASYQSQSFTQL